MASTHPDGLAGSFKRQVALFRRDVDGGIPLIRRHDLKAWSRDHTLAAGNTGAGCFRTAWAH